MFIRLTKSYVFILLSCKSSNFSEFNQIFFVFFFANYKIIRIFAAM